MIYTTFFAFKLVLLIFGLQFKAWINVWWLGAVVVTKVAE